jgi:dTDP-4-amino-4,6-dideoxygalactose transaminase
LALRAEIIREKGTDRTRFFRGEVDKYTWQEVGSSFLPGEFTAAFLLAQLEDAMGITAKRLAIWQRYHEMFASLEAQGLLRRPIVPEDCGHNAHMYYILLAPGFDRRSILDAFKRNAIGAVFHYIPLHSSPAGRRYGRAHGALAITNSISQRLVRLPMWVGLTQTQQQEVFDVLTEALDLSRLLFEQHE